MENIAHAVTIALLLFALYLVITMDYNKSQQYERFLPYVPSYGSWSDWDNYEKTYGGTRDYWGQWASGGGWSGHPLSPDNNAGGVAFMPSKSMHRDRRRQFKPQDLHLANATDEELTDAIKAQITLNK